MKMKIKSALLVAAVLAASAPFAASAGVLPGRDGTSASLQRSEVQSLNPQPLPPRYLPGNGTGTLLPLQRPEVQSLNPQPLPPRYLPGGATLVSFQRPGLESLNPQPLPPGEAPVTHPPSAQAIGLA